MSVEEVILAQAIAIQVGRDTFAPAQVSMASVLGAVERFNAGVDLPGLDAHLNAEALDGAKVQAFIEGLRRLDAASLRLVSNTTVRLNFPSLQLHRHAATPVEAMRAGYRLEALARNDNPALAAVRLVAAFSQPVARQRIERARQAVDECDAALKRLRAATGSAEPLNEITRLRHQRRSAALVWLALAVDLSAQSSAPPDARALVDAARKALATESVAPASGGMPG